MHIAIRTFNSCQMLHRLNGIMTSSYSVVTNAFSQKPFLPYVYKQKIALGKEHEKLEAQIVKEFISEKISRKCHSFLKRKRRHLVRLSLSYNCFEVFFLLLEIKRWFDCLDINKDDRVPVKKIAMGNKCIRFNPTDKEATAIIRELDSDGSGYVRFEKFEAFMKEYIRKREYELRLYKKAFRKFDKDGNGSVSYEELKQVFAARGKSEKDVEDFFKEADTNNDGQVDFEEFVIWFSRA